jgi:type I restriction enzyme M protein
MNPTNMIPRELAERRFWRGRTSGLQAWDLLTPNRASSNIGEFVILLPGEEEVVLTKEVFRVRCGPAASEAWDPFYLLWAFCLRSVRQQWQRVALMQTNREDVGQRYREVRLPQPRSAEWARSVSEPFRTYFTTMALARESFMESLKAERFEHISSVYRLAPEVPATDGTGEETETPT